MVCEARRAGPILCSLKERVEQLLAEWPDHPGLLQVMLLRSNFNLLLFVLV